MKAIGNVGRVLALAALVPLLGADAVPSTPLLVTTRSAMIYVAGASRQGAAVAGARTGNYRLLETTADGSVLVSYDDDTFAAVEAILPSLEVRVVKRLPRSMATYIAPSTDGFLAYDASLGALRRYDAHGSLVGAPAAGGGGATEALGVGDTIVGTGNGRLSIWDRGGRLRRQVLVDAFSPVALPNDRFAVAVPRDSEVRVYTTALDVVATLRLPVGRAPRLLAAGPDGSLAVLIGAPSCIRSDAEVDVYDDVTAAQPRVRIRENLTSAVALTLTGDALYVANAGYYTGRVPFAATASCRDEGTIAVFGRDGTSRGVLTNVGSPTGVMPLPRR